MRIDGGLWQINSDDDSVVLCAFGQVISVNRDPVTGSVEVNGASVRWSPQTVVLEEIAAKALEGTGFSLEGIRARVVFRSLNAARVKVMLALRRAGITYTEIGQFLHRNHTTVVEMCRRGVVREIVAT
jgi:hypothetical protein